MPAKRLDIFRLGIWVDTTYHPQMWGWEFKFQGGLVGAIERLAGLGANFFVPAV
jgi:hypothetical protein